MKPKKDNLARQLKFQVKEWFRKSLGYSNRDLDDSLFSIDVDEDNDKEYTEVYLSSEAIDFDGFRNLKPSIDRVVQKFDTSAYFDIVNIGLYVADIYWIDEADEIDKSVFSRKNMLKFANVLALDLSDEFDDYIVVDEADFDDDLWELIIKVYGDEHSSEIYLEVPDASSISSYNQFYREYFDDAYEKLADNMKER